jgi:hypothetical protein
VGARSVGGWVWAPFGGAGVGLAGNRVRCLPTDVVQGSRFPILAEERVEGLLSTERVRPRSILLSPGHRWIHGRKLVDVHLLEAQRSVCRPGELLKVWSHVSRHPHLLEREASRAVLPEQVVRGRPPGETRPQVRDGR